MLGAFASGALWGAAGVALFPAQSVPHQVFVCFVVAGMVAGAVATLAPVITAFALFALPAAVPIVLQLLLSAGELHWPMSFMAMLFGLAMWTVARHVNATIRESLSVSQRNAQLVDVLRRNNAHTQQLNSQLVSEVERRRAKEEALRANEQSLAEAQRMAHLGSWTYDARSRRAFWSAETFRIYGLEPAQTPPSCRNPGNAIHRRRCTRGPGPRAALPRGGGTGALALLFVDVDRFKNINDALGHDAGDRVLKEVAARMRNCLRASDLVARFGGDEFTVLLEDLPPGGYVAGVATKVLDALADPVHIEGQEFRITVSIGIATYPQDARDARALQKNADVAMFRAKAQGRNDFCYYSPQGGAHSLERLTLEAQLERALERGEFEKGSRPCSSSSSCARTAATRFRATSSAARCRFAS